MAAEAPTRRVPGILALPVAAAASVASVRGLDDDLLLELPFVAALAALAAIDLEHRLLPNRIVYPLAVWGLVASLIVDGDDLVGHLISGAGAFLFLYLAALANPEGMGMGDVKLAGVMGLYLGPAVVPALLVAFVSGALVGVGLVLRKGASALKRTVPFGVFLALGGLVGVLAGAPLIELYEGSLVADGTTGATTAASRV
jgi:leader peptidase (prepilin peptidase) / N-methyltransferase